MQIHVSWFTQGDITEVQGDITEDSETVIYTIKASVCVRVFC